jgi:antitoxin component YwqK of YwqJK toxin-antitoxin module
MISVYKKFFLMLGVTVLLCISASAVWSETMDDLVKRDGLYYKKFNNVPFTGKVEGKSQGSFKNGKRNGYWFEYHKNGYLKSNGEFRKGKKIGSWVKYYINKQLKSKGKFNNGEKEGQRFKYYSNGQLKSKGYFTNSKKKGFWEWYNLDGTINAKKYGMYKNDKKISD